jgi:hypothetical protein
MRKYILTILLCVIMSGCDPFPNRNSNTNPDADTAALSAVKFARESFIDLDQPRAYGLLSQGMQSKLTQDQFIDLVAEMHPKTFPRVVTATEYEPVTGKQAMNIFLYGENGDKKFYYRLTIASSAYASYKVTALFRIAPPPPSPSRKPLPVKRSTADVR